MKHLLISASLWSLSLVAAVATAAENYCHDRSINAEWERLLARHEGDTTVTYLYALRNDLCAAVDAGKISLEQAVERFESERQRMIEQHRHRLQEQQARSVAWANPTVDHDRLMRTAPV
ncbi:MAG: hypothetical protein ACREVE_09790 [Gammaproteobacteria bacterium]